MKVSAEITGTKELSRQLVALPDMAKQLVVTGVSLTGEELRNYMIELITKGPRSGVLYVRGGVSHRASASGEPPKKDTGQLDNSIFHRQINAGMGLEVGSNLKKAGYLEDGTKHMDKRPFIRPAAKRFKPVFIARLKAALEAAKKAIS
jgi:HK97 gp10 family phage protein